MGFLDKLNLNKLKDAAESFINTLQSEDSSSGAPRAPQNQGYAQPGPSGAQPGNDRQAAGPSGFSWGPVMPAEENQYNFPGNYVEYFDTILRAEFPAMQIDRESVRHGTATTFTFAQGGAILLVIEVMSETSSAQRIRRDCKERGIQYLRFYYNHQGWWNTKAYVLQRVHEALRF